MKVSMSTKSGDEEPSQNIITVTTFFLKKALLLSLCPDAECRDGGATRLSCAPDLRRSE